jgi:hypothetical protein
VSGFKLLQTVIGGVTSPLSRDVPAALPPPMSLWDPLLQEWFCVINTAPYKAEGSYACRITVGDASAIDFRFALE